MTDASARILAPDDGRLDALLRGVEILSPASFRIGNGPAVEAAAIPAFRPAGQVGTLDAGDPLPRLRGGLATALYFAGYAKLYAGEAFDPACLNRPLAPDPAFVAALAAANPTASGWEPDWRVFQVEATGAVHVGKGERATLVQPGRYALPVMGRPPGLGDLVELVRDRDSLQRQPGLYFAFGETIASDYDQARTARLYFNADPAAAQWLLQTVGTLLNRFRIPYAFKCPTAPDAFDRFDSVVFYVARRFVPTVLDLIRSMRDEVAAHLRPGTPLFTRPLFQGFGVADEPGTGESFGQSRSRLVAAGLVDGWASGHRDPAQLKAAVAARFSKAGLSMARPYLAAGLADVYDRLEAEAA